MNTDSDKGYVVVMNSVLGNVTKNDKIEVRWVENRPVNTGFEMFYRSYTDENGVHHTDGSFNDVEQARNYMYKLVAQDVQDMLRKGWVNIKVNEEKVDDKKAGRPVRGITVTVYGKNASGTRGRQQVYGIFEDKR